MEFSVNGQDYISQRDLLIFDIANLTNASYPDAELANADGGILTIDAKEEYFRAALMPFPYGLQVCSSAHPSSLRFSPHPISPSVFPYGLQNWSLTTLSSDGISSDGQLLRPPLLHPSTLHCPPSTHHSLHSSSYQDPKTCQTIAIHSS